MSSIEIRLPVRDAAVVVSKLSKLGKRGITGGVSYNLDEIPDNVKEELLCGAIEDFLRGGYKNANQDTITSEEARELMNGRLELLKSGATAAPGAKRGGGKQDPTRALARKMLKDMFKEHSEEDIPAKDLTKMVSDLFKRHKEYHGKKTPADVKAKLEPVAQLVDQALADAAEHLKKQEKLNANLAKAASLMKQAKAAASQETAPAKPAAQSSGKKGQSKKAAGPSA